jgi:plasmid stabilization system protein ParE
MWAYVARDSPHYAQLAIDRIVAAMALLEGSPRSGRVVPEVSDESLRKVIHGNYRSLNAESRAWRKVV